MAAVDLVINLLAAAIQEQSFGDRFNQLSPWWLGGLAVAGLLIGYWLGTKVELEVTGPTPAITQAPTVTKPKQTVTITRLRALLSYAKLRGQGVHLSDIVLIGARLDIDSRG
ncbi:MAG TPA: hypothetical protein VGD99_20215 [Anaerolineae bacterium]